MKEALLITYYWPPAGGPGVHRWLRFSRYFAANGWKLTVYCPEDAEWPVLDKELEKQVDSSLTILRLPIFEPHKWLGKKNNPNKGGAFTHEGKTSLKTRLIMWVRGNWFIPDARRFWIKPSVHYLEKYLKQHPEISVVISTGPPHSLHLIGSALQKKCGIKWVADFRDPWTGIDFYRDLMPGKKADALQRKMEKECLSSADAVVTISRHVALELEEKGGRQVDVITNGYPFEIFDPKSVPYDPFFTLAHFGSMPASRNPEALWKELERLTTESDTWRKNLKIKLTGPVDASVFQTLKKHRLENYVEHIPQVAHAQSIHMQKESALLLLVANTTGVSKGTLTGKFFEYLGARRPILALGPAGGDLEEAFKQTNCGYFLDYSDYSGIRKALEHAFEEWQSHTLYVQTEGLDLYSSSSLAARYCDLLNRIAAQTD